MISTQELEKSKPIVSRLHEQVIGIVLCVILRFSGDVSGVRLEGEKGVGGTFEGQGSKSVLSATISLIPPLLLD